MSAPPIRFEQLVPSETMEAAKDVQRLSANFARREFACRGVGCCGGSAPVDPRLVAALQELRDELRVPIRISSGFRCRTHNARVGGAPSSYHTLGMAADIVVRDIDMAELARKASLVRAFLDGGIGTYAGWVHVDVRGYRARWQG